MHLETQTKSQLSTSIGGKFIRVLLLSSLVSACSFVELTPGAGNIIFVEPGDDCESIQQITVQTKTDTLLMDRKLQVVAQELQTLAQNAAYKLYANAIWPRSEINEQGQQTFEILRCP